MAARVETAKQIADKFDRRVNRIKNIGIEAIRLRSEGAISLGSSDAILESSHLSLVTAFEVFIEDLFFSLALGASGTSSTISKVDFRCREDAELVVKGGRAYIDWLPFETQAKSTAKIYFQSSPFDWLDGHASELEALKNMTIVRNRIAHDSGSARTKFQPLASHLRPRRRTPAGHLQELSQGLSRHARYVIELQKISRAISSPTIADAKAILSPESFKQVGSKPGAGTYRCTNCKAQVRLGVRKDTLTACIQCSGTEGRKPMWRREY